MKALDRSVPGKLCLILSLGMILHFSSNAQCTNGLSTRVYDTVLTGIGYGNYAVKFPQWRPDSGLLVSVKVRTSVSLQYKFALRNVDSVPSTYSLFVGREEQFSSAAISPGYDNSSEKVVGTYSLDPGDGVSPGAFMLMSNFINTDSITSNIVPFLGTGQIPFAYSPATYTNLHTSNDASYYYSASVHDTMHFSITYTYCKNAGGGGVLAATLLSFMAAAQDAGTVQLDWTTADEVTGREYEVQQSRDGQAFTAITSLPARTDGSPDPGNGSGVGGGGSSGGLTTGYSYIVSLPGAPAGKWYFRLNMKDPGGSSYSAIKEVTMAGPPATAALSMGAAGRGLSVYPNPAVDFVNLVFDGGAGTTGNWQTDLFSADGRLLQQDRFSQVRTARIDFRRKLSPGTYFIRVTDLSGQHASSIPFTVLGSH